MEEWIAKGELHTMWMVVASIVTISAQQPGVLVAKIPILYSWKKQTKPQKQKCYFSHTSCPPCGHCRSPCEGYSLFLGTGLYGEPFLPWCTRQTRCPLPNIRWLKPAGDPHIHLHLPPIKTNQLAKCQTPTSWRILS